MIQGDIKFSLTAPPPIRTHTTKQLITAPLLLASFNFLWNTGSCMDSLLQYVHSTPEHKHKHISININIIMQEGMGQKQQYVSIKHCY